MKLLIEGKAKKIFCTKDKNILKQYFKDDATAFNNKRKKVFKNKGITNNLNVLNYCGGGIAASLDAFVLFQLGYDDIEIYDNSMSEWATDENLPIEIG